MVVLREQTARNLHEIFQFDSHERVKRACSYRHIFPITASCIKARIVCRTLVTRDVCIQRASRIVITAMRLQLPITRTLRVCIYTYNRNFDRRTRSGYPVILPFES